MTGNTVELNQDVSCIRLYVEWTTKTSEICDLDLKLLTYDDRALTKDRIDGDSKFSHDRSCELVADIGSTEVAGSYLELAKINLSMVDPSIEAILLVLDGGVRNFSMVDEIKLTCRHVPTDSKEYTSSSTLKNEVLFETIEKCKDKVAGMFLCVLYKEFDRRNKIEHQHRKWRARVIYETMDPAAWTMKYNIANELVTKYVPSLDRFRTRTFATVRDICAALSSRSLPNLKKIFMKHNGGLPIAEFTQVIFNQLYVAYPVVLEDAESACTIALIEEMFAQIDYNNDQTVDWNEFTTFCVQIGIVSTNKKTKTSEELEKSPTEVTDVNPEANMTDVEVKYFEDATLRDQIRGPHRNILSMRFNADTRKITLVSDASDHVTVLDDQFNYVSKFGPLNIQIEEVAITGKKEYLMKPSINSKFQIYDVVYIASRHLYAFTCSDHTIVICREHITLGGQNIKYWCHNRIMHNLLHKKMCWSASSNILCTVASDQSVFGWDLDLTSPIFHIARHDDIITDFIAADHLDLFITASMDKRIMLWSASTQRVKGLIIGHTRGVRSVSCHHHTLLSAGFESDARTWDVRTNEPIAILRGHRFPIVVAKLMCDKACSDAENLAVTVDESGEFRLWNVFVQDKLGQTVYLPALQVFSMNKTDARISQIKFLAFPYDSKYALENFSDIVACSNKLLRFRPEKNIHEYCPPTCGCFNEASAVLTTSAGKFLLQYDACSGELIEAHWNVYHSEITSMCLDGGAGRRLFAGCNNGDILLLNFMTGSVIESLSNIHSDEITSIACKKSETINCIFTASRDGKLCLIDEVMGSLALHHSCENIFDSHGAIIFMKYIEGCNALLCHSAKQEWGVWNSHSLKRIIMIKEESSVLAVEHLKIHIDKVSIDSSDTFVMHTYLVIAVALMEEIRIYKVDFSKSTKYLLSTLQYNGSSIVTALECIRPSIIDPKFPFLHLIGGFEDGTMQVWKIDLDSIVIVRSIATQKSRIIRAQSVLKQTNWKVHCDSVVSLIPLHDHSAFASISLDGYMMMWQIFDDGCLGEIELPYVTAEMRVDHNKLQPNIGSNNKVWKFVLEKVLVSDKHIQIAAKLVNEIRAREQQTKQIAKSYALQRRQTVIQPRQRQATKLLTNDDKTVTRNGILSSMREKTIDPVEDTKKGMGRKSSVTQLNNDNGTGNGNGRSRLNSIVSVGSVSQEDSSQSDNSLSHMSSVHSILPLVRGKSHRIKATAVWSTTTEYCSQSKLKRNEQLPKAFSDASLTATRNSGLITSEEYRLLREIGRDETKAAVYESAQPTIYLRDAKLATSVKIPSIDSISPAEITFGSQSDLFKNAVKYLNEKDHRNLKSLQLHVIAMSRIEQNIKDVGNMIHIKPTKTHEEVYFAKATSNGTDGDEGDDDKMRNDEQKMRLRLLQSSKMIPSRVAGKARVLDKERIQAIVSKVQVITDSVNVTRSRDRQSDSKQISALRDELENKLCQAATELIKFKQQFTPKYKTHSESALDTSEGSGDIGDGVEEAASGPGALSSTHPSTLHPETHESTNKPTVTAKHGAQFTKIGDVAALNRALLPYYTAQDVQNFVDVFFKVDSDFNGELNINQWIIFFSTLQKHVSELEVRKMFYKLDRSGDGLLQFNELLPILFSKANKQQLKLIIKECEAQFRTVNHDVSLMSMNEVEELFACYDVAKIGYIKMSFFRDRMKRLNLAERILHEFLNSLDVARSDDLVNCEEFVRILKSYISKS